MLTKKGFFNTRFYVDDGISGTTFERDGFKTMLNDVQNGEVKTVIVKDMSRFGRDYIQVGMYTEILFPQNNVRFIAINDSYDSANGDNDFIPFKNIMNEWYAKDTSKKIKAVNRARARAGEHLTSNVPYGYIKYACYCAAIPQKFCFICEFTIDDPVNRFISRWNQYLSGAKTY